MSIRKLATIVILSAAVAGVAACEDESEGPDVEAFTATLTAASEPPTATGPVVSTGTGTARIEFTSTGVLYTVTVNNARTTPITSGGTHIHGPCPPATCTSAGVVLGLNPNITVTTGTIAQGSATGPGTSAAAISMDSLKSMIRNGNAYVNVHTTRYNGGEIRGQLVPAN